jgi:hypothetical protein
MLLSLGPEMSRVQSRMALGVQCLDALNGRPCLQALSVRLLSLGPLTANLELQAKGGGRFSLAFSGRFAQLWRRTTEPGRLLPRDLDLLVHEQAASEASAAHRVGPRRLSVQLALSANARPLPLAGSANTFNLRLLAGPNHPFDGGATLLRGRVRLGTNETNARAARWARLVAVKGGRLLGFAQADERGEYALLLRYPAGLLAPASPHADDGDISLTVAARRAPPAHTTPFDDLSPEPAVLAALDADPLANLPAAYNRRVTVARSLRLGASHSGPDFDFLLAP